MPPGARFAPFRSLIYSRPAALAAAVLSTLIVIGCMSLNISDSDPNVLVQTGSIEVQAGQEVKFAIQSNKLHVFDPETELNLTARR